MLERPARADRRQGSGHCPDPSATARQRRFRRRQRHGLMPVTIEVDSAIVAMLVETRWLAERDAGDKAAIGHAIERLLADAAQR
jgi:hypothetical protein